MERVPVQNDIFFFYLRHTVNFDHNHYAVQICASYLACGSVWAPRIAGYLLWEPIPCFNLASLKFKVFPLSLKSLVAIVVRCYLT